jgi:hypothetical protein
LQNRTLQFLDAYSTAAGLITCGLGWQSILNNLPVAFLLQLRCKYSVSFYLLIGGVNRDGSPTTLTAPANGER